MPARRNKFSLDYVNQTFQGTEEDDLFLGSHGAHLTVYGNGGNDRIENRNYNDGVGDRFSGGDGKDVLASYGTDAILSGGAGHDILWGYGKASFVFGAADATSSDVVNIVDGPDAYNHKFVFQASDYGLTEGNGLIGGQLDPTWFESGTEIQADHAVFFYNTRTNTLTWDPDGHGGADRIPIAKIKFPADPDHIFGADSIVIDTTGEYLF